MFLVVEDENQTTTTTTVESETVVETNDSEPTVDKETVVEANSSEPTVDKENETDTIEDNKQKPTETPEVAASEQKTDKKDSKYNF